MDNHPIHNSAIEFLVSKGVEVVSHPANSPDLNPLEHMFSMMKTLFEKETVKAENFGRNTTEDLRTSEDLAVCAPRRVLEGHPAEHACNVVTNMKRRFEAVLEADGKASRY